MANTTETDIALVVQSVSSLSSSITKLEGKVDAGNLQNTQISKDIAAIDSKINAQDKYQQECTADRKEIRAQVWKMSGLVSGGITAVGFLAQHLWGK